MLSSLQIENVAVIQKANVHFEKGLNVLTGETGAGKSILIDSINAILGNRTSKDLVRTGAAKAVIRAAFEDVPPAVLDSLEKAGYERSEALLLSREITAEGKSTCRINGMPATAAILRELCGCGISGYRTAPPADPRQRCSPAGCGSRSSPHHWHHAPDAHTRAAPLWCICSPDDSSRPRESHPQTDQAGRECVPVRHRQTVDASAVTEPRSRRCPSPAGRK